MQKNQTHVPPFTWPFHVTLTWTFPYFPRARLQPLFKPSSTSAPILPYIPLRSLQPAICFHVQVKFAFIYFFKDVLIWTIFKVFTEFVTLSLLFYVFWFFGHEACGILVPQPEIEPAPPALEGEVLTTGPPGKSPNLHFYQSHLFYTQPVTKLQGFKNINKEKTAFINLLLLSLLLQNDCFSQNNREWDLKKEASN